MRRWRELLRGRRGTAAVEFAVILPVFLLLLFAVVELGSAWYQKQMLVNASRVGVRMGSLLNDTATSSAQVQATVTQYLQAAGYPGAFTVNSSGVDGNAGDQVQVTVTSNFQLPVLGRLVPGVNTTVTLQGVTVMRHE